jgi:hypothetical protein
MCDKADDVYLISFNRGILVFLQRPPEIVQSSCYRSVHLGNVIFVGRGPAIENQGGDDQEFNQ